MRRISTSNGCRSFKSVDCGLRPRASETLLLAPANIPFGEDQGSSASLLVLIFSITVVRFVAPALEMPASAPDEGQEILVDPIFERRAHAVRCALVNLERGILDQLGRKQRRVGDGND